MQYTITYSTGQNPSTVFSYMFKKEMDISDVLSYSVLPNEEDIEVLDTSLLARREEYQLIVNDKLMETSKGNAFSSIIITDKWLQKREKFFKEFDYVNYVKASKETEKYHDLERFAYSTNIRDIVVDDLSHFVFTDRNVNNLIIDLENKFAYKYDEEMYTVSHCYYGWKSEEDLSIGSTVTHGKKLDEDVKIDNLIFSLFKDSEKANVSQYRVDAFKDDSKVSIWHDTLSLDKEYLLVNLHDHSEHIYKYDEGILKNTIDENIGMYDAKINLDDTSKYLYFYDHDIDYMDWKFIYTHENTLYGIFDNKVIDTNKLKGFKDELIGGAINDSNDLFTIYDSRIAKKDDIKLKVNSYAYMVGVGSHTLISQHDAPILYKEDHKLFRDYKNSFLYRDSSTISKNDCEVKAHKNNENLIVGQGQVMFSKDNEEVVLQPSGVMFNKDNEEIVTQEGGVMFSKDNEKVVTQEGGVMFNKDNENVSIDNTFVNINKDINGVFTQDTLLNASKRNEKGNLDSMVVDIKAESKGLITETYIDGVSKNEIKTNVSSFDPNLYKSEDTLILGRGDLVIKDESTLSLPLFGHLLEKDKLGLLVNDSNDKLKGESKSLIANSGEDLVYKYDSSVLLPEVESQVTKREIDLFVDNSSDLAKKGELNVYKDYDPVRLSWDVQNMSIQEQLFVKDGGYVGNINQSMTYKPSDFTIDLQYESLSVVNGGYVGIMNDMYLAYKDGKSTKREDICWWISPKEYEAIKNELFKVGVPDILVNNPEDDLDFYVEDFIPKIEILPGAIDELILPHMLFDYSLGKDQVVLENFAINKKFVEGFTDDNYVICSVPIEQPIKYYEDLCLRFINVDVELMWQVLETLYHHFRENIHYFAGADPVKALNAMIKRTHVELIERYSSPLYTTRLRQAERCLKLFVWYSEVGLMVHSHKKVVHDRRDGVLGFFGGRALPYSSSSRLTKIIPDDEIYDNIGFSANGNHILSSTVGYDSTISFKHVPQNIDTLLKFKGYIILQGELTVTTSDNVYTFTNDFNDITIVLPSDDNSFTIRFKPYHVTSYVDLATFVVEDRYNVGYELKYIGKLSNPNHTIEYILSYMKMAGDSMDDVNKVLENTAQISYTLEMFREYLYLHHDKKIKGVRMTSKQ